MAEKYSIDQVNKYVRNWLIGCENEETKKAIDDLYHNDDDSFSPFW